MFFFFLNKKRQLYSGSNLMGGRIVLLCEGFFFSFPLNGVAPELVGNNRRKRGCTKETIPVYTLV